MMKKVRNLNRYLKDLSKENLIKEIYKLIKRFPQVKKYYQSYFNKNQEQKILEAYKKRVRHEFFPTRGFGKCRLPIARKAVSEYKRINSNISNLIDLMLYYVENGVRFTLEYGDINEAFYNSMESMFDDVLELIAKNRLHEQFRSRCQKILYDTNDLGWGFPDNLNYSFEKWYKDFEIFEKDK